MRTTAKEINLYHLIDRYCGFYSGTITQWNLKKEFSSLIGDGNI